MDWIITNHAADRLEERNLPHPQGRILKLPGPSRRKTIRKLCPVNGCDVNEYIYYTTDTQEGTVVYVAKQKDIGIMILITAFLISDK